ncbi:MAG: acyl-CoA dehydratase activase [Lachnospiraceae bacterium]|nr:acyl-CoA dehydratase activase [Lachnospiraceae bacterium]
MITIGIDSGTQRTKAVIIRDEEIISMALARTNFNANEVAEEMIRQLLDKSNLNMSVVEKIYTTGVGSKTIQVGDGHVNEIMAAAAGVCRLMPECRCVLDLGAERNRVIRLDDNHKVQGYEVNDKCASGSGTFIENMARVLETSTEEFGSLALHHKKNISLSAQCVVFVESEVISLIHQNEDSSDIAWGILTGAASHVITLINRFGKVKNIGAIGGLTLNPGLMEALKKEMGQDICVVPYSEYVSAYGAALLAAQI